MVIGNKNGTALSFGWVVPLFAAEKLILWGNHGLGTGKYATSPGFSASAQGYQGGKQRYRIP